MNEEYEHDIEEYEHLIFTQTIWTLESVSIFAEIFDYKNDVEYYRNLAAELLCCERPILFTARKLPLDKKVILKQPLWDWLVIEA